MSVREEEQRKNNCPSRGLGLAAAAIGVGVGAALYYFFSKRQENSDAEGSTSGGWRCQQPQALNASDEEYTTTSENTTSDTSILEDSFTCPYCNEESTNNSISDDSSEESIINLLEYSLEETEESSSETEENTDEENDEESCSCSDSSFEHTSGRNSVQSPISDETDWDVTNSSLGIPDVSSPVSPIHSLFGHWSTVFDGQKENRERSWSLEECAICFEIMLKDQELMALPCTHNFHVACIGPWLQEQQTCPMCRKAAE